MEEFRLYKIWKQTGWVVPQYLTIAIGGNRYRWVLLERVYVNDRDKTENKYPSTILRIQVWNSEKNKRDSGQDDSLPISHNL